MRSAPVAPSSFAILTFVLLQFVEKFYIIELWVNINPQYINNCIKSTVIQYSIKYSKCKVVLNVELSYIFNLGLVLNLKN